MNNLKNVWQRIKNIKHLHIYVAVLVGIVLVVGYFGFVQKPKTEQISEISTSEESATWEYVDKLENKLCNVLSQISGVGSVSTMITLESGFSYEYVTESEVSTSTSGGNDMTVTTYKVVMVNGQPVIVKVNYPVIKGVMIVAKGAENFSIKMNILNAVTAVLKINSDSVTILS